MVQFLKPLMDLNYFIIISFTCNANLYWEAMLILGTFYFAIKKNIIGQFEWDKVVKSQKTKKNCAIILDWRSL